MSLTLTLNLSLTGTVVVADAAPAPAELFPYPTLTGSSWTINNAARMSFDGNDLSFLGSGAVMTCGINAAGGGDTLAAALVESGNYNVRFTIANYVDGGVGDVTLNVSLRGGTAVEMNISANGVATTISPVTAGATTTGLNALRFTETDGNLATFKITDISITVV